MSNESVYAAGLLSQALDPATQPPAIRDWLALESARLEALLGTGHRVVDFGCGTGRHLVALAPRLALGVGLDYQRSYIAAAASAAAAGRADGLPVQFLVADATRAPCRPTFDFAICTTNTWGTMPDKPAVLAEMRRLAPKAGRRIVSVYAPTSRPARREWYARLGRAVRRETEEYLETVDGFQTEHFTEERLRALLGPCVIEPIGTIGFLARV